MPLNIPISAALHNVCNYLPACCIVCNQQCRSAYNLCPSCEDQLPALGSHCHHCGRPFAEENLINASCGNCLGKLSAVDDCHGLFRYSNPIKQLIAAYKYQAKLNVGHTFAHLLANAMLGYYEQQHYPDLLLPVPLHYRRFRQRGFNQSWDLARTISFRIGVPTRRTLITKTRHTEAQSAMNSANARKRNLRGVFAIDESFQWENVNRVTIIDDVVTTMTTVSNLSKLLKHQGVQHVEVWCIARASRH